jgi:3-hydroxyacyl-CoA dehydrogenase/enoyl-CoA hydratase/3-hydroxybutyryl-CoA epimerase
MLHRAPAVRRPDLLQRLAGRRPLRPLLALYLERRAAARADPAHYPAPRALIRHWRRHGGDDAALYDSEAREVSRLLCGDTARNLIRVFQLRERLKALGREAAFQPRRVHVVGAGVMGGDIAAWCALSGLRVTLQDTAPERIAGALQRAHTLFRKRLHDPLRARAAADRLLPDHKGHGIPRAEVIVEAIYEDLEAKRNLFRELDRCADPDALLASNTSAIPLAELAGVLARPERLVGLHFFNPVAHMQLVEVVHDPTTDPQQTARAQAFVRRIERLPLPVRSAPGFLVNRVLMPYLLEAVDLLDEGVPAALVDAAARDFGMPVGPLELADSVGLDICLAVAAELAGHTATPAEVPARLRTLVDQGRLGRKSGAGFYSWRGGRARVPHPPWGSRATKDLTERLVFRLLNEAVACLREGIVTDPDLLDAGVVFGTGFAPFRGGPLHYIAGGGLERMHRRLDRLHHDHGEHFHPDAGWGRLGHI